MSYDIFRVARNNFSDILMSIELFYGKVQNTMMMNKKNQKERKICFVRHIKDKLFFGLI